MSVYLNLSITNGWSDSAEPGVSPEHLSLFGSDEKPIYGFEDWGSVSFRIDGARMTLSGRVQDFEMFAEQILEWTNTLGELKAVRDARAQEQLELAAIEEAIPSKPATYETEVTGA